MIEVEAEFISTAERDRVLGVLKEKYDSSAETRDNSTEFCVRMTADVPYGVFGYQVINDVKSLFDLSRVVSGTIDLYYHGEGCSLK